ncbi:hypothetical protein AYO41_01890 [Verrucomicrobia bacterium SCGC AG-212-E04]|nr:hypothetical protein AYO41_01890 [Verrucomicrobia bacterium SCGC AG-212-E04]
MAKRLTQSNLKPEIDRWVAEGVIQPDQGATILARYPAADGPGKLMAIFISVGVVLILGGIALVIASNWEHLPATAKMAGLLLLLAAVGVVGIEAKSRAWARAWWDGAFTAASVLPLLGLALVSQIFHVTGKATGLFLGWVLLIFLVPWLTRSVGAFFIFLVALFCLQQAWLYDYMRHWLGSDGRYWNDEFAMQTLAAAIFGLACAGLSRVWLRLGESAQAAAGEYVGVLVFFIAAYTYGIWPQPFDTRTAWPFVWLTVFVFALLLIYRAVRLGDRRHQLNLGFVIIGLVIMSTYIRLVGTMMNTALIFLSGGVLLLACAFGLAIWRRRLVSRQAPSFT